MPYDATSSRRICSRAMTAAARVSSNASAIRRTMSLWRSSAMNESPSATTKGASVARPVSTSRLSFPLRSAWNVRANRLEVELRHPLSHFSAQDGPFDDRRPVVNAVVYARVDDFLDDFVRAVEMTVWMSRRARQRDAAWQPFGAEEVLDRVRIRRGAAAVR